RPVFEQRVFENGGDAAAVPVQGAVPSSRFSAIGEMLNQGQPSSFRLLCVLSRSSSFSRTCLRSPSTTFVGALVRKVSLPSRPWPLAISFSSFSSSFFRRSHSDAT